MTVTSNIVAFLSLSFQFQILFVGVRGLSLLAIENASNRVIASLARCQFHNLALIHFR